MPIASGQTASPFGGVIGIANQSYGQDAGAVSFDIVNLSKRRILAYTVSITFTMSNGKTNTTSQTTDFTGDLAFTDKAVVAPPGVHMGPLAPGQTKHVSFAFKGTSPLARLDVTPILVVYDDNAFIGDPALAALNVFNPHQAAVAEFEAHLLSLGKLSANADIAGALNAMLAGFQQALSGVNVFDRTANAFRYARDAAYPQIVTSLQSATRSIARGGASPHQALQSHTAYTKALFDAYSAHLNGAEAKDAKNTIKSRRLAGLGNEPRY
jgi:hypothetical protein